MIPTKRVRVLAISTLSASLAVVSTTVAFNAVPLLSDTRKRSSGAMLRTTDPTIKLTTGKGPGEKRGLSTNQVLMTNILITNIETQYVYIGLERCVK
jgi:hypothetical protein